MTRHRQVCSICWRTKEAEGGRLSRRFFETDFGVSGEARAHLDTATVRHQLVLRCRAASLDASARRPYQKKLREGYGSSVKMHPGSSAWIAGH